jgi:hypothetical protein
MFEPTPEREREHLLCGVIGGSNPRSGPIVNIPCGCIVRQGGHRPHLRIWLANQMALELDESSGA